MENNDKKDIIDAINVMSTHVDSRLAHVDSRLDKIEGRLTKVEATMVTKDYLDDKLADMKGDLIIMMRKGDHKVVGLINLLKGKSLISEQEAMSLLQMEPFPQLYV